MTTLFTNISERAFKESQQSQRLFAHDNSRRFARLDMPETSQSVFFSWRSDTIEPVVLSDSASERIWVGVDNRLAAMSHTGKRVCSLTLDSPLLALEIRGEKAVAVCELQLIVINADGSMDAVTDFPDVVEDFQVAESSVIAAFMDGTKCEFAI